MRNKKDRPKPRFSLKQFYALFDSERIVVPGDPNEKTSATTRGHVHKVKPMWMPKSGDMPPSQWKRRRRLMAKKIAVKKAQSIGNIKDSRVPCLGECGKMVIKKNGECRDCRRARVVAGKRRIASVTPNAQTRPNFETAKQKFDRVKAYE